MEPDKKRDEQTKPPVGSDAAGDAETADTQVDPPATNEPPPADPGGGGTIEGGRKPAK